MKTYTLDEVRNELIGKRGTAHRDQFEYELQMDLIGKATTRNSQKSKLLQEKTGKLIGALLSLKQRKR